MVFAGATLVAIGLGLPAAGSLGSGALESAGAWGLHLQFGALVLMAVVTSRGWRGEVERFKDGGWPSLRALAVVAPLSVAAQIGLGAAYRYKVMGMIPHVLWAFVAAIVVMMYGSFVLTQTGVGKGLKIVAGALMGLTGLQVVLGVAALIAKVAETGRMAWMEVATAAHLVTGALVLALTLVVSAYVLRAAEPAGESAALASTGQPT